MSAPTALLERAARHGFSTGYHDQDGYWHAADPHSLQRLLAALGPDLPPASAPRGAFAPAYLPPALGGPGRVWALGVQLYGLRSEHNWGIGDFGDLRHLVELAARAGAAAVQLNPLHALFTARPAHCSPYAPSSRWFINPLYIEPAAVPEMAASARADDFLHQPGLHQRLAALRASPRVDYPAVAALKLALLRLAFADFMDHHARSGSPRYAEFLAFRRAGGRALEDFAWFEALDHRMAARHPEGWLGWPAPWRDQAPAARADFVQRHPLELLFPIYLQWLAHTQLAEVQRHARAAGMAIGLINDLAVGADRSGADAWRDPELLALEAEIGAPPDAFAAQGQAWGLPPWRPAMLAARDYAPWRELLAANMAAVGGLRVDHVMGCERQFWVPRGGCGRDGAYLAYPRDVLLEMLAETSRQHHALVIGEDLGTVPAGFSARLAESAMLSTRVLRFERHPSGWFRRPDTYPPLACVCAGTHDMPPLASWLDALGASDDGAETPALLHAALVDAGMAPASAAIDDRIAAVHAFLAATPCRLLLVQLEDILAELEPANRPGSGPEQPNWQRKYRLSVANLPDCAAWRATAASLRRAGRARPGT